MSGLSIFQGKFSTSHFRVKEMVQAIFWDNDGVLVDTEGLYFQATAEILSGIGIHLSREQFINISLQQGKSVFQLAEAQGVPTLRIESLRLARNDRYSELLAAGVPVLEGVEEVLKDFHGRFRMAVVTSSLREHFHLIHRSTGLLKYFDFVLTREDYAHSKPHPEPYLLALDRSGLNRSECLVVEDSVRGLRSAEQARIPCVVIPGSFTRDGDFSGAAAVLKKCGQLPSFLA